MSLEIFCCACRQGFWGSDHENCPTCAYWQNAASVDVSWSEDSIFAWVEQTEFTPTAKAAWLHFIKYIAEKEGFDTELLYRHPELLEVSPDVTWWKPGVAPFAEEDENGELVYVQANPGDRTAMPFWRIDVSLAWQEATALL